MAKARQIVKRRKAVTNIRKITKTMQLIATTRFQAAFRRATATKPYTQKITQLVQELSQETEGQLDHTLMRENPDAKKNLLLILTSNRGLCGGYNSSILRQVKAIFAKQEGRQFEVHVVGKKGIAYLDFLGIKIDRATTDIDFNPRFDQVDPIASEFMQRYASGEFHRVHVVYMRFISAGKQIAESMQLLPMRKADTGSDSDATPPPKSLTAGTSVEYEFSPEPGALLDALLPQTVKVRLFQCFTDAAVSEQVARMVAMKAATDAAGEMITLLSRQFNRARQTQITLELLDIVGGAEALK